MKDSNQEIPTLFQIISPLVINLKTLIKITFYPLVGKFLSWLEALKKLLFFNIFFGWLIDIHDWMYAATRETSKYTIWF